MTHQEITWHVRHELILLQDSTKNAKISRLAFNKGTSYDAEHLNHKINLILNGRIFILIIDSFRLRWTVTKSRVQIREQYTQMLSLVRGLQLHLKEPVSLMGEMIDICIGVMLL